VARRLAPCPTHAVEGCTKSLGAGAGEFEPGQLRTLQRQIRRWRAMHGPSREVMFPQDHQPGQLGAFDFTHCEALGVTIAGAIFVHLMFQFVPAWSGWRYIEIAHGETYEALLSGLQGARWELGGVPASDGA